MLCYSESSCAEIHFYMDEINRTSFRWVHEQTSASSQLLNCGLTQRDAWGRYDPTFQPDLPPEPQPRPPQRLGGCFHLRNPKRGSCVSKICCWQLPEFSLSHSSSESPEWTRLYENKDYSFWKRRSCELCEPSRGFLDRFTFCMINMNVSSPKWHFPRQMCTWNIWQKHVITLVSLLSSFRWRSDSDCRLILQHH